MSSMVLEVAWLEPTLHAMNKGQAPLSAGSGIQIVDVKFDQVQAHLLRDGLD